MSSETRGEIYNPSDKAFIDVADPKAACAAVLFLSHGKYALKGEGVDMPVFWPGSDACMWWLDTFGVGLSQYLEGHKQDVAAALESVELAGERTSMNDIMGRAKAYAKGLR